MGCGATAKSQKQVLCEGYGHPEAFTVRLIDRTLRHSVLDLNQKTKKQFLMAL